MENLEEKRKSGAWLIGGLGGIAITVASGAFALGKGLIPPTGMVTETDNFRGLELLPADLLEFGGCDIRKGNALDIAQNILQESQNIGAACLPHITDRLKKYDSSIEQGLATNCGKTITSLSDTSNDTQVDLAVQVETIRQHLRSFKKENNLEEIVVVNLASTEPELPLREYHFDPAAFSTQITANNLDSVRASTIYTYAAILEGCPYINFTPSNGALIPALVKLAEETGVPVMGNDGKTGETLLKSILAPMFSSRNLEVLSWAGFNILGNMDGKVLDNPENKKSKLKSKDKLLSEILGYDPHSNVDINYVPSLSDQKIAWDFIHFQGFMGTKMSLQFTWQGYDSMLAAPIVLDLIRLALLAKKRGERGLMSHLGEFFKTPIEGKEYQHHRQHELLIHYAEQARKTIT
jgi:myo-inositol-1-phosphate synthase